MSILQVRFFSFRGLSFSVPREFISTPTLLAAVSRRVWRRIRVFRFFKALFQHPSTLALWLFVSEACTSLASTSDSSLVAYSSVPTVIHAYLPGSNSHTRPQRVQSVHSTRFGSSGRAPRNKASFVEGIQCMFLARGLWVCLRLGFGFRYTL